MPRAEPHLRASVGRRLALAAALLCGVVGTVGLIGRFWPPTTVLGLFVAAVSPYLLLLFVPAAALALVGRGRVGRLTALVTAILLVVGLGFEVPLFTAAGAAEGGRVSVMTANLKLGSGVAADVVRAVRDHDVDLLMLQELTPRERTYLAEAGLDRVLPYSSADPRDLAQGTGLWSRYPITQAHIDRSLGFSMITATVPAHDGIPTLTAIALHAYGPVPFVDHWRQNMGVLRGRFAAVAPGPVVVGGDFNATYDVAQFRSLLRGGYHDAAEQSGAGWLPTFPADSATGPLIGIDHVLLRGATAVGARTVTVARSDHRALQVDLRV